MKTINPNWKRNYKEKLEEMRKLRSKNAKPTVTEIPKVRKQYSTRHVINRNQNYNTDFYNDEVESRSHLTTGELEWLI